MRVLRAENSDNQEKPRVHAGWSKAPPRWSEAAAACAHGSARLKQARAHVVNANTRRQPRLQPNRARPEQPVLL